MELKVLYFWIIYGIITWVLSLIALSITSSYRNSLLATQLPGAPLATNKLDNLFLPPMVKLQDFVFFFDTACLCWYLYQLPILDKIKNTIPAL